MTYRTMISRIAALLLLTLFAASHSVAMDVSGSPTKFPIPWGFAAGAGFIRVIPVPSQIGIQNCAASLTDGFPPLTFSPAASGGCPPFGQDFNGILNQITLWSQWQGAGGPLFYDPSFSSSIGGYPQSATLSSATVQGCYWVSTVDNNTSNPDLGGLNWNNTCSVGGVLTGTLPDPGLAAASVANSNLQPSAVAAANLASSALSFDVPVNLQINASVAASALTISIVGNNGSAPSSTNPVVTPFRNAALTSGAVSLVSLTAPLSLTIASGSTMACPSSLACRLWILEADVSGTAVLCAYNANSGTGILGVNESAPQSSASGTSGGNSAQTLYCNVSAIVSAPVRYVGYVDITESTAGTWTSNPSVIQLFGPGIKKPGDIVAEVNLPYSTLGSTATVLVACQSVSPPTASNGGLITSLSYTPQSAANWLSIDGTAAMADVTTACQAVYLILNTSPNAVAMGATVGLETSGNLVSSTVHYEATAGGITSVSMYGTSGGGTVYWNGLNSTTYFNNVTGIRIREIMGANDNLPLTLKLPAVA